jgi:Arc/MetJ-type ribon-helix-helix transcriptional regulator
MQAAKWFGRVFPGRNKERVMIPSDVQDRVNALLGTGLYASEAEILRAAVAALEEQNADLAAIQRGIDDMENGRCRPFADFDTEFRERNQVGHNA